MSNRESGFDGNDKYLTKQEVKKLFAVIETKRDRAIFHVIYFHGLRASEVGQLQLGSYNPADRRLYIRRLKGSLASNPEVSRATHLYLSKWIKERGSQPGPLFPSSRGTGISRKQIFELMRKYCVAAAIDRAKAHPHALKHSVATHLLNAGVDLYTVKKLLGHKKITSTEVYLHVADSQVDSAARRFQDEW